MTRGTFLPAPYLDEYGEADKVIFLLPLFNLLHLYLALYLYLCLNLALSLYLYLDDYGEADKVICLLSLLDLLAPLYERCSSSNSGLRYIYPIPPIQHIALNVHCSLLVSIVQTVSRSQAVWLYLSKIQNVFV